VPLRRHSEYSVSLYAKSSPPGAKITLAAQSGYVEGGYQEWKRPISLSVSNAVGSDWERLSATGRIDDPHSDWVSVQVEVSSPVDAVVHLDAIQLNEGSLGQYRPATDVECALVTSDANNLFYYNDTPTLAVRIVNYADDKKVLKATLTLIDLWERVVVDRPVVVSLAANQRRDHALELPIGLRGAFRASLTHDERTEKQLVVSVVPRPLRREVHPDSTFGNHLGDNPAILRAGQRIGTKWARLHDTATVTYWNNVEPKPGKFAWYDDAVDGMHDAGLTIMGCLGQPPEWAWATNATPKSGFAYPRSIKEWRHYVRRTVAHYSGKIDTWHVWNEGWGITGEQIFDLQKSAYEIIKDISPDATVIFEYSTWQGKDYLDAAKAKGVLDYCDVIATHIYTMRNGIPDNFGPKSDSLSEIMALLIQELGPDAKGKPIWMDEGGIYNLSWYSTLRSGACLTPYTRAGWVKALRSSPIDGARFLPRYYSTFRAAGGAKYFYYWAPTYYDVNRFIDNFSFFEPDGSLRPIAVSFAVCANLLDGSRFVKRIELSKPDAAISRQAERVFHCNLFEREDEGIAVIWLQSPEKRKISLNDSNAAITVTDMMGNETHPDEGSMIELSEDPVYVRVEGGSVDVLERVLSPQ